MSIISMTGFARVEGGDDTANWFWEARSVNGRGLDVRLRLAPGCEELEPQIRALVAKRLRRGNVTINLQMKRTSAPVEIRVNEEALAQVARAAKRVDEVLGSGPLSTDAALAVRGVLEVVEADEAETARASRHERLLEDFSACLAGLAEARAAEGGTLAGTVAGQVEEIARLATVIEEAPARTAEAINERLRAQVRRLIDEADELDDARLHQEVALLATRADIAEELDRLRAHVGAAKGLLADEGPVGRRFDFLAQEFNREANTICSKSNDAAISQAGMALKVVIDQLREQVQNVE